MSIAGSFTSPSPMRALLLRAAVLPGEESLAAWKEWNQTYGFEKALDLTTARLLPAIGHAFFDRGVEDTHFRTLTALCLQAEMQNTRLLHQGVALASALEKEGIACMFLKGSALLMQGVFKLDERTLGDIDLLVRPVQREGAIAFLQRAGWSLHELPGAVCAHGVHLHREGLTIDLHWYVMKEWCSERADEKIWQRSTLVQWDDAHVRVPAVTDILLNVLVNGARSFGEESQWALDASRLLNRHEAAIDWQVFLSEVRERRLDPTVQLLFSYLSDTCNVHIRPEVSERLSSAPKNVLLRLENFPEKHPLHSISLLFAIFLRHEAGEIGIRTPFQFLYFLRGAWGLDSWKAFPRECITRILRRLSR